MGLGDINRVRTFNLLAANNNPRGIGTTDGNSQFVAQHNTRDVYFYYKVDVGLGVRGVALANRLHADNDSPASIGNDENYQWVGDSSTNRVFCYSGAFTNRVAAREFTLPNAADRAVGIGVDDSYVYCINSRDRKVYVFNKNGVRQAARESSAPVLAAIGSPTGLAVDDTYVYITDFVDDLVYVFDKNWNRHTVREFRISSSSQGIGVDDEYLYVVDNSTDELIAYDKTPDATAPGAPSTPTLSAGLDYIDVSWSAPGSSGTAAITEYDVEYRTGSGSWTTVDNATSGTSYRITGLNSGTRYEVRVRAVSSVGNGSWSSPAFATTLSPSAQAPTAPNLIGAVVGTHFEYPSITMNWTAASGQGSPILNYAVELRERLSNGQYGGWTWDRSPLATARSYRWEILKFGVTYQVRVQAENLHGRGPFSNIRTITTPATTPDIARIRSLTAGDQTITVQWSEPASRGAAITNYDVSYKKVSDSNWTTVDSATDGSSRSYTITNITNGTEYGVRVRAVNSVGNGEWSNERRETPSANRGNVVIILPDEPEVEPDISEDAPGKPTIAAIRSGNFRLEIEWNEPNEGTYPIQYYDVRIRSSAEWTLIDRASQDTEHRIRGLQNGLEYDIQVRAVSSVGPGPWSDIYVGIPQAERLARVGIVSFATWDNRIWGITENGRLFYCYDFDSGWIEHAKLPSHETPVQELFVYPNVQGDPVLYVITETGVFIHDHDNERWNATSVHWPRSPRNGKGAVVWREDLYIPVGMGVYRLGSGGNAVLSPVGPDRDQGVPTPGDSRIVKLVPSHNYLLAVVQSQNETDGSRSYIMAYDTVAWFIMWYPSTRKVLHDVLVTTIYGDYSIWIGHDQLEVIDLPVDLINPDNFHPHRRYAASAEALTPWFNSGEVDVDKIALTVNLDASNIDAGRTITVEYALDGDTSDGSWQLLTSLNAPAHNGVTKVNLPAAPADPVGMEFRSIRFRIRGQTDNPEISPDLHALILEYEKRLPTKFGFQMLIDLNNERGYKGRKPGQLIHDISAVTQANVLKKLRYRNPSSGEVETHYVEVERFTLNERTGRDQRAQGILFAVEP